MGGTSGRIHPFGRRNSSEQAFFELRGACGGRFEVSRKLSDLVTQPIECCVVDAIGPEIFHGDSPFAGAALHPSFRGACKARRATIETQSTFFAYARLRRICWLLWTVGWYCTRSRRHDRDANVQRRQEETAARSWSREAEGYADECRRERNFRNSRPSARRRLQTAVSRAISLRNPNSFRGRK